MIRALTYIAACGIIAFMLGMLAPAPKARAQAQFSCQVASIADGDSIRCHAGRRLRLFGIDAPEGRQPHGAQSHAALASRIAGQQLACTWLATDRYARLVARCYLGFEDIGQWMVREGFAWAFVRYSAAYIPEEQAARAARKGLWADPNPVAPWDWRQMQRSK